jgi:hypothetical protein
MILSRCIPPKMNEVSLSPPGANRRFSARRLARLSLAVWLYGVFSIVVAGAETPGPDIEFYERKIRPLLTERCYECHSRGSKRLEGGLALDTRAGISAGGENGPIINSNKPDESLILAVVNYDGDIQMPPAGKLSSQEIGLLTEWVGRGAPLAEDGSSNVARQGLNFEAGRKFWSFQPLRKTPPPATSHASQPGNPIDAFLLAALENRGIRPSPRSDGRTLIRRATFDLLGLPPSPEEVDLFVNDPAPDAYDRLLDRLLASPHYGERWGRYWLDLTRYADGNKTSLEVRGQAWLYRDWVVRALNDDMPYDDFVRRQLAVDQMPGSQPADLAALGFLGLSPEYFKELKLAPPIIKAIVADEWEERIDALGRTFLGLSLACARCHDHKFDPIGADDYYALAGVLASSRLTERFVIPESEAAIVREAQQIVKSLNEQIKEIKSAKAPMPGDKARVAALEEQLKDVEGDTPRYDSAMAHAIDDAALQVLADGPAHTRLDYKPGETIDLQVHIRGNPMKLGHTVPRRFLTVLSPGEPQPFRQGSGRLELAQALVGQAAPLSARVIVNRVWAHHFGRGLVETVSDFGTQGERPSHPELLDDLTCRFVEHGWSLKWLHREIMGTAAYRQVSAYDRTRVAADPDNRLLWRMNRRRLDVEAWRDAILASCGNLDRRVGGPPVPMTAADNGRRTLYGRIDRSEPDDMLRLFDFPEPSAHSPHRAPTTTALQQLFVLNSPFIARQAATLARRLTAEQPTEAAAIVRRAYRLLFARNPSDEELRLGVDFLMVGNSTNGPAVETVQQYAQALLGSNEFSFID